MSEQYYKKINLDLSGLNLSKIRGGPLLEGYGDNFRSYSLVSNRYFQNFLSQRIKFKIPPLVIHYTEISNYGVKPHTDPNLAVINYFINAANATTTFWSSRDEDKNTVAPIAIVQNKSILTDVKNHEYDVDQLTMMESFCAESNSAYIMNTRAIHSVSKPNLDDRREFIRFLWLDLSMEELIENIIYI